MDDRDSQPLRQRQQRIYERAAADYDALRFGAPAGRWLQTLNEVGMAALLQRHLSSSAAGRLCLDLGCGTGRLAVPLTSAGIPVIGLDASSAMMDQLRRREKGARVPCVKGDAFCLPFPDATFDAVYSLRLFHLFDPDLYPRLISEIHRVLRPGGVSIIEVNNPDYGIGLGWWRDRFRRRRMEGREVSSTVRIGRIQQLWAAWELMEIRGIWWPGFHRKAERMGEEAALEFHERVGGHELYKRVMFFYWVVGRKP